MDGHVARPTGTFRRCRLGRLQWLMERIPLRCPKCTRSRGGMVEDSTHASACSAPLFTFQDALTMHSESSNPARKLALM